MNSIVKKAVTGLVASAALIGAVAATPAEARPYGYYGGGHYGHYYGGYGHRGYRGWGPGAAIGLGIAGLAVGAALASPHYGYDRGGYGYEGYAPPPAYYGGGYRCRSTGVWDPYIGQYVQQQTCY